jgi:hypothetical protein
MPEYMQFSVGNFKGAFEEDINLCVVLLYFRQEFIDNPRTGYYANFFREICKNEEEFEKVVSTIKNRLPEVYEKFYNVTLLEGESMAKDEQIWKERYKNNFQVRSIWGSIHDSNVPQGQILILAKNPTSGEEKKILMPEAEYTELRKSSKGVMPILNIESYALSNA